MLITLTETLIILHITKTESNDCFIIPFKNNFLKNSKRTKIFLLICFVFHINEDRIP